MRYQAALRPESRGSARLRLEGEGAKQEAALSHQIVRQVRMELEEILQLLRR